MNHVFYNTLGEHRSVYDGALQCFRNLSGSFPAWSLSPDTAVVHQVLLDHPEIFYVQPRFQVVFTLLSRNILVRYSYSPQEIRDLQSRLDEAADRIIARLINPHQSEYDRVLVLHDYLKTNLEYDDAAAANPELRDRSNVEAHNIVGALLNRKCVCEGFAKAMKYLCDKIGLECMVVSGDASSSLGSGPHAWNIVRINGYYHHVDITWDNQFSQESAMPNYAYLNLSDEQISRDHRWNRQHYPPCPDAPYSYFRVNDALVDSRTQLESLLYNNLVMEQEQILFRVVRGSTLEREIRGCLPEAVNRAAARCRRIRVRNFRYGGVDEQLTYFVRPEYSYC